MMVDIDIGLESPYSIQSSSFPLIFRKVLRTSMLGLGMYQIKSVVFCRQCIFFKLAKALIPGFFYLDECPNILEDYFLGLV